MKETTEFKIKHFRNEIKELHEKLTDLMDEVDGPRALSVQDACTNLVSVDISLERSQKVV